MPRDKTDSHRRVLAAAREEFMTYGFENASMRRIGQQAGMTAAGLYRHCRDKEDLFGQLVSGPAEDLKAWMTRHAADTMCAAAEGGAGLWNNTWIDMMRELVYPRMEEYRLLLCRSQGTVYENYLRDLTDLAQKSMLEALELLKSQGRPVKEITTKELHLLLSGYTAAVFEPVINQYSREDAERCLATVEAFFLPGWQKLMGF